MKRHLERIVAATASAAPTARRVVVLSYHSVHPTLSFASATPALFGRHVEWLRAHCTLVSFNDIPSLLGGERQTKPTVALTFDDGYEDNYTHALPLLAAVGAPATIFVATGLVARDPTVLARLSALWGVPKEHIRGLEWSQMREMHSTGIRFGAHTVSHPNLGALDPSSVMAEMRESRTILESNLGTTIDSFAYPFGNPRLHISDHTVRCAAGAGFKQAGTVQFRGVEPSDGPLSIPRFPVTRDSVAMLEAKVVGRLDSLGWMRERAPRWVFELTSRESPRRLERAFRDGGPSARPARS